MQTLKIVLANIYLWAAFTVITLISLLILPLLALYAAAVKKNSPPCFEGV